MNEFIIVLFWVVFILMFSFIVAYVGKCDDYNKLKQDGKEEIEFYKFMAEIPYKYRKFPIYKYGDGSIYAMTDKGSVRIK